MKVLMLVSSGLGLSERAQLIRASEKNEYPRIQLFEEVLNSDVLDESHDGSLPIQTDGHMRFVPKSLRQIMQAYTLRDRYDAIISWSENRTILLASVLKVTRSKTPHIGLMYWLSRPGVALMLPVVHSCINRIVTWSSVQRNYAIQKLGIPAEKIVLVRHPVDQLFWRPMRSSGELICSVGSEMRDFPTLVEAMRGMQMKCHIASRKVRIIGKFFSHKVEPVRRTVDTPANVVVQALSLQELRRLYARSRFVVVPLLPSDTDNGVNTILEAMAMGKAVICSQTKGQVDVVRHEENGLYVPPGDVQALRKAINYLWTHPQVAKKMGNRGREHVEKFHTLERFSNDVKRIVEKVIEEKRSNAS